MFNVKQYMIAITATTVSLQKDRQLVTAVHLHWPHLAASLAGPYACTRRREGLWRGHHADGNVYAVTFLTSAQQIEAPFAI